MATKNAPAKKLKVTLTRSLITEKGELRRVVAALGLRRLHQSVEHNDTPSIRGMIAKIAYMVKVEEN